MGSKPSSLCNLQKGKFVGGQKGFVDTFNWIKDFIGNLKGEKAKSGDDKLTIEIDGANTGKPVLKIKGETGMKLKSGDDSNVVISDKKDTDGYYKIDVYYK